MDRRVRAAEVWVKALRTGEASATATLAGLLAPDVALDTGGTSAPRTDRIPDFVKEIVNRALANNTPLIVAYTGVEQRHDLERDGATLIIEVDRLTGSSPRGGVRMVRQS